MKKKNIILLGGIVLFIFVILWNVLLDDIIPHSRQYFWSYESFNEHTEWAMFPKSLPSSAHELSYYVYEGYFQDACGYHVALSEADYTSAKEERIGQYQLAVDDGQGYCYETGEKTKVSLTRMEEKRIDFLDKLVPADKISEYYTLCEAVYENSELFDYEGILCNDETCEMIEISFYGPSENNSTAGNHTSSQEQPESINIGGFLEIILIAGGALFYMFWLVIVPMLRYKEQQDKL